MSAELAAGDREHTQPLAKPACAGAKAIIIGEHAVLYGAPIAGVHLDAVRTRAILRAEDTDAPPGRGATRIRVDAPNDPRALVARTALGAIGREDESSGLFLEMSTSVPLGRGLGSSASAFLAVVDSVFAHYDACAEFVDRTRIAQIGERVAHGVSSGFDVECVARGPGMHASTAGCVRRIAQPADWVFLVGDSGDYGATHEAVSLVHNQMCHNDFQCDEMDYLKAGASCAVQELTSRSPDPELIGRMMLDYHHGLARFGISTPKLDRLVDAAIRGGAVGAKLSGSGLGGSVIALTDTRRAPHVEKTLRINGAVAVWAVAAEGAAV